MKPTTSLGRWTMTRPLTRYETETLPARTVQSAVGGSYTIPAHETTRSIQDGYETFEVEILADLDALATWLGMRAACSKRGISKVQEGILIAKVLKRAKAGVR